MQKIHKLFEFPHGHGWIAVQNKRSAIKIIRQGLITGLRYNQSRKICKFILPDILFQFGWCCEKQMCPWMSRCPTTSRNIHCQRKLNYPSQSNTIMLYLKITVWNNTNTLLTQTWKKQVAFSNLLPVWRFPNYRFISFYNEHSYSTYR